LHDPDIEFNELLNYYVAVKEAKAVETCELSGDDGVVVSKIADILVK